MAQLADTVSTEVGNDDNDDELIPCEVCEQGVPFSRYADHLHHCARRAFMFPRLRTRAADPESGEDDIDDMDADDPGQVMRRLRATRRYPLRIRVLQVFIPVDEYESNLALSERIGTVTVGVKDPEAVTRAVHDKDAAFCPICQDTCDDGACREVRTCGHRFCQPCISTWFKRSTRCPVCMRDATQAQASDTTAMTESRNLASTVPSAGPSS